MNGSRSPKVSVILATHNRASSLGRAARSVLAQTFKDLELLIVDDASTDDTAQVVQSIADPRIRYFKLETPQFATGARNHGAALARGEYLAFQDDDDLWLIEKLEHQVRALDEAEETVGVNLVDYIADYGTRAKYYGGRKRFEAMDFSTGRPLRGFALIATPGWLVKRSVFEAAGGFDPDFPVWVDWELAYRMAKVCRFSHLEEPLYIQDRQHGGGITRKTSQYAETIRRIIGKHGADFSDRNLGAFHRQAGLFELMYGSAALARTDLSSALSRHNRDIKAFALWLTSFCNRPIRQLLFRISTRLRRGV